MYPLTRSAAVSEAAQKNGGKLTQPIGRTRSTHRQIAVLEGSGGTM